jgi:hypothetical protein
MYRVVIAIIGPVVVALILVASCNILPANAGVLNGLLPSKSTVDQFTNSAINHANSPIAQVMAAIRTTSSTAGSAKRLADVSRRINVACVGDSITRGSRPGVKEPSSYPAYLLRLLGRYLVVDS